MQRKHVHRFRLAIGGLAVGWLGAVALTSASASQPDLQLRGESGLAFYCPDDEYINMSTSYIDPDGEGQKDASTALEMILGAVTADSVEFLSMSEEAPTRLPTGVMEIDSEVAVLRSPSPDDSESIVMEIGLVQNEMGWHVQEINGCNSTIVRLGL